MVFKIFLQQDGIATIRTWTQCIKALHADVQLNIPQFDDLCAADLHIGTLYCQTHDLAVGKIVGEQLSFDEKVLTCRTV
jgi:hypothetical protein